MSSEPKQQDWVLVPRQPTTEMLVAYHKANNEGPKPTMIPDLWSAMINAAPKPQPEGGWMISERTTEALKGAAEFFKTIATGANPAPLAFSQAIRDVLAIHQAGESAFEELLEAAELAASVLERRLNASGLAVDEFGEDALQRLNDAIERAKGRLDE